MKFIFYLPLIIVLFIACNKKAENIATINISEDQRYPIIMIDPNINAWSATPTLYSNHLQHSDGYELPLVGIIRVDGKAFRFMGSGKLPDKALAGMSSDENWDGRYTFIKPDNGWESINYNDKRWDSGKAPFGKMPSLNVNTIWPSPAIWLRREIKINPNDIAENKFYLKYSHDDELQLFVNGIELIKTGFEWKFDEKIEIPDHIVETFKDGKIVIAAFCKNLVGEAFLDFGIYFKGEDDTDKWNGKYIFSTPAEDWQKSDYNDQTWEAGGAPFGSSIDYRVNTEWNTRDIWVRREIQLSPKELEKSLLLEYSYDDNLTLFINGIQILQTPHEFKMKKIIEIPEDIKKNAKDGKLTIAAHCRNESGGAYLDFQLLTDDIAKQKSVAITATQTHYTFQCGQVRLNLRFTVPFLLDDIEIMSRPINYISYDVESLDGQEHQVELYFEASSSWVSNNILNSEISDIYEMENMLFLKTGLSDQKIFDLENNTKRGGWGNFYISTEKFNASAQLGDASMMRHEFMRNGTLTNSTESTSPKFMGIVQSLGKSKQASGKIMIGYDDIYSIQYFGENLRPYWNRKGNKTIEQLFIKANNGFDKIINKCILFDNAIFNKIASESGFDYASFLIASYRKSIIKNKLVEGRDSDYFLFHEDGIQGLKDNLPLFSNYNIEIIKAQLKPFFYYCESGKWQKPYPPTNLGQYPLANGQVSEFGDSVEAASELLTICAAIAAIEGNTDYISKHWTTLTKWHDYLVDYTISNQTTIPEGNEKNLLSIIANTGISSYTYMAKRMSEK